MDGLRRRKAEASAIRSSAIRSSPQSLRPKDHSYTLRPSPRLGPWSHATLLVFLRVACCFGFFLAAAFAAVALANRPGPGVLKGLGWVGALLVLPAALFGAVMPARWLARRLPARCPFCNGRGYRDGASTSGRGMYEFTYTCRDCGQRFRPDGARQ